MLACKKCNRSYRNLTTICAYCGRKLTEQSSPPPRGARSITSQVRQAASRPRSGGFEPLPPLPKSIRPREASAVPVLEAPDYLGAEPHYHGRDHPMVGETWEKSPRLDPGEIAWTGLNREREKTSGWTAVAVVVGIVLGALGGDD